MREWEKESNKEMSLLIFTKLWGSKRYNTNNADIKSILISLKDYGQKDNIPSLKNLNTCYSKIENKLDNLLIY